MQVRFLTKTGERFTRDIPEPLPPKYVIERDNDPQSDPSVQKLARAIFDKRMSAEATRIGEGNPGRVLDIMWLKTKLQEREAAITEALSLSVMMGNGQRTFRLHKARGGGQCFIELGAIFNDLTALDAPTPVRPVPIAAHEGWVSGICDSISESTLGEQTVASEKVLEALRHGIEADAKTQRETLERRREARQARILALEDKLIAEERLAAEQAKASKEQSAHMKDVHGYAPGWNASLKF